jgi:hypothetical protein
VLRSLQSILCSANASNTSKTLATVLQLWRAAQIESTYRSDLISRSLSRIGGGA